MHVALYTPKTSSRLDYVLTFVFRDFFSASYEVFHDVQAFDRSGGIRINYSHEVIPNIFRITPNDLLFDRGHRALPIEYAEVDGLAYSFGSPDGDLPFDLFAFIFYHLSRYEEYGANRDAFGRFSAKQSDAYRHHFLQDALLDRWLLRWQKALQSFYGLRLPFHHRYACLPTVDIDLPWAYAYKHPFVQIGGFTKDLATFSLSRFRQRLKTVFSSADDPFDTYDYLLDRLGSFDKAIAFVLMDGRGGLDRNRHYRHAQFYALLKKLSDRITVALHPSVRSGNEAGQLNIEKRRLEEQLGRPVDQSRQHYLILDVPETYRRLLDAGIRTDYSLGYADAVGFRASTARSFYWYDLMHERQSELRIQPFQVMDVTLKRYLQWAPADALQHCRSLITTCRDLGGTFSFIWHNSSFDPTTGWELWKAVFEGILEAAAEN